MNRKEWEKRIRKNCEEAATYEPYYDSVIATLAGILEKRDRAEEQFEELGGDVTITYINKAGHENTVKNPALVAFMDLNSQALSYWRELGLTPSGLKKIITETKAKPNASFEELLSKLA